MENNGCQSKTDRESRLDRPYRLIYPLHLFLKEGFGTMHTGTAMDSVGTRVVGDGRSFGVVVIGRNEGDNLMRCLESAAPVKAKVVYVDSGSSDGSVEAAGPLCGSVLPLDPSLPFSAARARNEGFDALTRLDPDIGYVQFLDGDCTLEPGWPEAALEAFRRRDELAIVVGRLSERHPDRSAYNQLCALEWRSTAGDLSNHGALGGIMMVRADVFRSLGGFNPSVIAGEDSEFGVRVALAGGIATKIDAPMATHDANILRFSQWWKRSVRAGHAIGQRFQLNGASGARDCERERMSTLAWGVALPLAIVAVAPFSAWLSAFMAGGYVALFFRIARSRARRGDSASEARLYGFFTVLAKFANGIGLLKFYWRRRSGLFRIIEYK